MKLKKRVRELERLVQIRRLEATLAEVTPRTPQQYMNQHAKEMLDAMKPSTIKFRRPIPWTFSKPLNPARWDDPLGQNRSTCGCCA